jgi:hypothetical protein
MQERTYKVIAYIDGLDFVVGLGITENELDTFLEQIVRKQDYKNVRQFDIIAEDTHDEDALYIPF